MEIVVLLLMAAIIVWFVMVPLFRTPPEDEQGGEQ